MKLRIVACQMMMMLCMGVMAQSKFNIKGLITDKETKEVVEGATVQLLHLPDSSFVKVLLQVKPVLSR